MNEQGPSLGDYLKENGNKNAEKISQVTRGETLENKFNPFLQNFGKVLSVEQIASDKEQSVYTLSFGEGKIIKIGLDQNGELEFAQTGTQQLSKDQGSTLRGVGLQQVHNLNDIVSAGYIDTLKDAINRSVVFTVTS